MNFQMFKLVLEMAEEPEISFPTNFFSNSGWGIDLDYCDIEWFALEMNRDHSVVFEIASKHCISDSFVDSDAIIVNTVYSTCQFL